MGKTLTEKILDAHLVEGEPRPGEQVAVRIDQTLTQDATGTMAYLQLEAMSPAEIKTELSVSYVDHNTLQMGYENADDHRYLQSIAEKYGIYLSRAGNGICHQVHLERFGAPGKTLLGSDSHTPTGGGLGMIASGAGGLDVAVAMAGGPFWLTYPRVVGVKLSGELGDWVSAKDVILTLLKMLTTKGNVGTVMEYFGPGVETLSVPERATITNMGAELGVTTSVFPSDRVTRAFLEAQGRGDAWRELAADADAAYDRVVELELGAIEPMVAQPHSPDNVVAVREIAGLKVDQVCIGSCTNSSYKDLATAAEILDGKTISPGTSLIVAPGSKQVLRMIADDGHLARLVAAGARLSEAACGFCIGMGHAPASNAVSVRTNNRNFYGRSGTASAGIYLVSPETAAVAAWKGELTDLLCFGFDPYHNALNDLTQDLLRRQQENTREVYENLQRQGYALSPDALSAILAKPSSQQPHALVALLKEHGYGLGEPSAGKIVMVAGCTFATNDPAAVVEAAHRSGAVCLLVHPGRKDGFMTYAELSCGLLERVGIQIE